MSPPDTVRDMDDERPLIRLAPALRARRAVVQDAGVAAGYTTLLLVTVILGTPSVPPWVGCAVAGAVGAPLAVRRLFPRTVAAVVLVATVAGVLVDVVWDPFLALAFSVYALALAEPNRRGEPVLAVGAFAAVGLLVGAIAGTPTDDHTSQTASMLAGIAFPAGAWALGRSVRARRTEAEAAARELAARVAADERLRVARDVHDIVSHTLSLVGVKAGVARHVAAAHPGEAQEALTVIEEVSRSALLEMRELLGTLRTETGETESIPGMDRLPELVDRALLAGVDVRLSTTGLEGLTGPVATSVYRIVSEAVTNVIRHSGSSECAVAVRGTDAGVEIEVSDGGVGGIVTGPDAGHGLIGMRERARAHGGTLTAGPGERGGFVVTAHLPLRREVVS